jgi:hypothetical protein
LEGLHLTRRIDKDLIDGRAVYGPVEPRGGTE